ncbi:hypothetical protein Halru_0778 [Halovivax ruber XH-70]|uniref:Uncharacterized protein n=2 Tax=Halovivax ruber TaxID=387341 RepID=L0I9M0_HALRX|nr:hypothetical protein Halru_0778 [Halovivax ruber XH-70]
MQAQPTFSHRRYRRAGDCHMVNETDDHGLDDHPAAADEEAEEADENDGLPAQQQEAREAAQESDRRQNVEYDSQEREGDALEQENPDYHRDEAPENS